jgi:hypothetical protein
MITRKLHEWYFQEFSQKDFDDLEVGWAKKLNWISKKEHVWGLYMAKKC